MGLQKVKVAADKALALVALLTLSTVKLANKARAPSRCLIAADSENGEATVTLEKRVNGICVILAVVWLCVAVATLLTMGGATAARNVSVL